MEFKLKLVKDAEDNNIALAYTDVTSNPVFKPHIVTDTDGKNLAVPAVIVGGASVIVASTSTAAATAVKVADGLPIGYIPKDGDLLCLKFLVANSAANPKVKIGENEYALTWKLAALSSSVYYSIAANQTILTQFNGTSFEFLYNPDWLDNDTFSNTNIGGNSFIAGETVTKYKLVMKAVDGKIYPLSIGDVTTATKTTSVKIFDLSSPALFFAGSGSVAAGAKTGNYFYYEYYYSSANIQYAFNGFNSTDFNKQLYLMGTIEGGGFKLDQTSPTSWYTTTIPTSANGKVYLPIGCVGDNANTLNLFNTGTYMQYKNGIFAPVGFYGL